jgi:hypothetical protein
MRKHPLLAFVTAMLSCTIPGTVTTAWGDTTTTTAPTADHTTTQGGRPAAVARTSHRSKSRHLQLLRLEAKARARARHLHRLRQEREARARSHHPHLAIAGIGATAHLSAGSAKARGQIVRAKIRAATQRPYTAIGGIWLSLRNCESRNRYDENSGNGYYGAYQFSVSSWHLIGQAGLPSAASPEIQDHAAQLLLARQGWHAWPTCSWAIGAA